MRGRCIYLDVSRISLECAISSSKCIYDYFHTVLGNKKDVIILHTYFISSYQILLRFALHITF